MNVIVNFVMRVCGLGHAVDALDGDTAKSYLGGVGTILTGLATLAGGAAAIASQVLAAHGGAAYLAIAQGLGQNPSAALVLAGAGLISHGISAIAQQHAIKAAVPATVAPAVAPPVTPPAP